MIFSAQAVRGPFLIHTATISALARGTFLYCYYIQIQFYLIFTLETGHRLGPADYD